MDNILNTLRNKKDNKKSELSKSEYSLVSCGDITPDAVQVWSNLPDEVKHDPTWALFQNVYEKEKGRSTSPHNVSGPAKTARSAPPAKDKLMPLSLSLNVEDDICHERGDANNTKTNSIRQRTISDRETSPTSIDVIHSRTKIAKAGHILKITSLTAMWIFFTVTFLSYNEKEHVVLRQSIIGEKESISYELPSSNVIQSLSISLTGPFMTEESQQKLNESNNQNTPNINVWYEHLIPNHTDKQTDNITNSISSGTASNIWKVYLEPTDSQISIGNTRTNVLKLDADVTELGPDSKYIIRINTTSTNIYPFSLSYDENPIDPKTEIILAFVLLIGLYVLISFELINRCMAAIVFSLGALAVLALVGKRPSLEEIVSWLDVETLLLLFSMMVLVAIIAETGMFDFLAVFTFEKTKGKIWPLIFLLCILTGVVSTFLDNVTTVLLMTPITLRLCEVMQLDPVPIMILMAIFSNIGGTATPVGDPPNVIITSNQDVIASGVHFTEFTLHMTFGIILVCIQSCLQLRYISYRDLNKLRLSVPSDIQDLKQQLNIWQRAVDSLKHLSKEGSVVKERLERKIAKLKLQIHKRLKENTKKACLDSTFNNMLSEMKQQYRIKDKSLLVKALIATSFVIIFYFLHAIPEFNRISLGWTALLGAVFLLILADREDLEPVLHRVEWSTLLFFAALFVFMESLARLGLIDFIGSLTESMIFSVDEDSRLLVALVSIVWVSGISSAFVDNIPLTTMMIRIVTSLGKNPQLGVPLAPLVFALSFGVCLGGNGTLIGASANVTCAGVAEQHGYKITFKQFFVIGFPLMIGQLITATAYLLVCHCLFTWHD